MRYPLRLSYLFQDECTMACNGVWTLGGDGRVTSNSERALQSPKSQLGEAQPANGWKWRNMKKKNETKRKSNKIEIKGTDPKKIERKC